MVQQAIVLKDLVPVTVTINTAIEISGLSRSTLLRRVDDGTLKAHLICGRRLIVYETLIDLLLGPSEKPVYF